MPLFDSNRAKPIIVLTSATTLTLVCLFAIIFIMLFNRRQPATDPFAKGSVPSVSFPLYYSTMPPNGYSADQNSVSEPQAGVIIYNLVNGHNKIVISEEARSPKMVNIGAFYQSLKDSKQIVVSDGSIATGYFGSMKVASRANNSTWILATTTSNVSFNDLTKMLQNLTIAL